MKKEELITKLRMEGFKPEIIAALQAVDRKKFVLPDFQSLAYDDTALPIGYGQTISQPHTIAFMLELLDVRPGQKILEVGSGSGYVLALLSELVQDGEVYGVEIVPGLVSRSKLSLRNYKRVKVQAASGGLGVPKEAPFDRILVSASAAKLPEELIDQLTGHGIMVCPVKNSIIRLAKKSQEYEIEEFEGYVFVPLIKKVPD